AADRLVLADGAAKRRSRCPSLSSPEPPTISRRTCRRTDAFFRCRMGKLLPDKDALLLLSAGGAVGSYRIPAESKGKGRRERGGRRAGAPVQVLGEALAGVLPERPGSIVPPAPARRQEEKAYRAGT